MSGTEVKDSMSQRPIPEPNRALGSQSTHGRPEEQGARGQKKGKRNRIAFLEREGKRAKKN